VKALKAQISGLAARNYPANGKLGSPDFTMLFVPIEAALGMALQAEPTLFENAWDKRVVLVGPNMLFGTLKVVGQLWSQEKRNKNAEEIAKRGGALYEKLVGFVADFAKAKEALLAAQSKLVEGPGNIIGQAQKLKELGAKTDKSLPPAWVEKAGED
jgi:DNA recombination protein RmuC